MTTHLKMAICDDDAVDRSRLLRMALAHCPDPKTCVTVPGLEELLNVLSDGKRCDLVLMDDRLTTSRAETSLQTLHRAGVAAAIAVVTGDLAPGRREALGRLGAMECVEKDALDSARIGDLLAMAQVSSLVLRTRPVADMRRNHKVTRLPLA